MTNADVVLVALRSWGGPDGTVCAPVAEIAALTELGEHAVRAALAELCADGRLIPTGERRRKTAIFRFASQPPTPRSEQEHEGAPLGATFVTSADATCDGDSADKSVAGDGNSGSREGVGELAVTGSAAARLKLGDPVRPSDEPSPEEHEEMRRLGLGELYAWLDRHDAETGPPDVDGGDCGECGRPAPARWSYGVYVLCRDCRRERGRRAATELGEAARPSESPRRELTVTEAPPHLADELADRLSSNGSSENGNGLWEQPDF